MKATEFWKEFSALFKDGEKRRSLCNFWYSAKDFTELILEYIGEILKKYGYETSKEYYRIDLTGWTQLRKDGEKYLLGDFEKHLWDLEVAVEHENSSVSWMDEVVKLLHINCPLRVVIGYLPVDRKDKQKEYLDAIAEQISETKAVKEQCSLKNGEFLIIIGDSKCNGDIDKMCRYTPYIYDLSEKKFLPFD